MPPVPVIVEKLKACPTVPVREPGALTIRRVGAVITIFLVTVMGALQPALFTVAVKEYVPGVAGVVVQVAVEFLVPLSTGVVVSHAGHAPVVHV